MKIPRKNSRQWKTAISMINANPEKWLDDVGLGHAEFIDDISRLRQKGWPIEDRINSDGFSRSYRLDRVKWDEAKEGLDPFWE